MRRAFKDLSKQFLILFLIAVFHDAFAQQLDRIDLPVFVDGQKLGNPFVGGFLSPQFNAVDLDLDGMDDLLVFDRIGDVIVPFIRTGIGPDSLRYAPEYLDIFPETKAWMILRDYNGDGINDIFKCPSVPGIPGIEVWKGVNTQGNLSFELVPNEDQPFDILYIPISNGFTQVYVSIIDIPAIEDIDGDGDLDVLSFEPGGTKVTFYKNMSIEDGLAPDQLKFRLEDNCFGKFQESGFSQEVNLSELPNQCASFFDSEENVEIRHSGSTITAFDENGDGLTDILLGDLSYNGLVLLRNDGTSSSAWMTDQDSAFPSYDVSAEIEIYNTAFYLDVDLDGQRDMLVAPNELNSLQNQNHVWYYKNINTDEEPVFRLNKKNYLIDQTLHFGTNSNPCFTDYNQDGLTDILVGTQGFRNEDGLFMSRLYLFENMGSAENPAFELVDDDYLQFSDFAMVSTNFAPAAGDVDGDGDIDLIVGDGQGYLYYVENIAGGGDPYVFVQPVYRFFDIQVGQQVKPFIFDLDRDGMGDLVIGERNFNSEGDNIGSLNYIRNEGTIGSPSFGDAQSPGNSQLFGGVDLRTQGFINNYSAPVLVDNGEDFYLLTGSESGNIGIYDQIKDNLDGTFRLLTEDLGIREGVRVTLAAADIDNDSYLELLVGNLRGGLAIYNTAIQLGQTVGIGDPDQFMDRRIEIFPNPGSEFVKMKSLDSQKILGFEVFAVDGTRIHRQSADNENLLVDTSSWNPGLYIFILQLDRGRARLKWLKL